MNSRSNADAPGKEKILLALLPFWAPLIPPVGIANLKSFLQARGYRIRTVDGNVADRFRDFSAGYFNTLKESVPGDKWGNFYVIGKDVLQNHMMAFLNYKKEDEYRRLLHELVEKTFFCEITPAVAQELHHRVEHFYSELEEWFSDLLTMEKPDVVGFSVFESTLPASLFAAQLTKRLHPETRVLFGGGVFSEQLAEGSPNFDLFVKRTPYIDKIFIGEGENLLLAYLEKRLPQEQRVYNLSAVGGAALDLANVDIPDFSDFDHHLYPFIAAYTSRSCPYQCSFCSETIFYGKYRKKQAAQVVEEMTRLYKKYGRQLFLMCDSLLNPVVTELAQEFIKSGQIMYWDGYLRADKHAGDTENTLLWRRGGFYKAKLGIESGSPHVLELMNKKITPRQIKDAVSSLAYAGIKTSTCWVIGHPGETEMDFQETLDMVTELRDDIYEVWASPFYYYPKAQADMSAFERNTYLLYPASMADMLLIQTWYPECEPSRDETYRRMHRFAAHCEQLGIPNPYTLHDLYKADLRWKELHENAVPAIMDFKQDGGYINDTARVKKLMLASSRRQEEGDFGF